MQFSYWENQHFINKADLIVIGSGIVGLNAAIAFKKKHPKKQVTIIEKGILPTGASTKNAGFACIGSVSELIDDLSHIDEKHVWDTVQLRFSGLIKLRQLIGDKNMKYLHYSGFEVFDSKKVHRFLKSLHQKFFNSGSTYFKEYTKFLLIKIFFLKFKKKKFMLLKM
jgi:hypothetical protein